MTRKALSPRLSQPLGEYWLQRHPAWHHPVCQDSRAKPPRLRPASPHQGLRRYLKHPRSPAFPRCPPCGVPCRRRPSCPRRRRCRSPSKSSRSPFSQPPQWSQRRRSLKKHLALHCTESFQSFQSFQCRSLHSKRKRLALHTMRFFQTRSHRKLLHSTRCFQRSLPWNQTHLTILRRCRKRHTKWRHRKNQRQCLAHHRHQHQRCPRTSLPAERPSCRPGLRT